MNPIQIFEGFKNINVVVIGDVMIDRYLSGNTDRISPEAPVPIVQLNQHEDRLGGAANVALNINALGAKTHLFSIIGNNQEADIFESLLPSRNIHNQGIVRSAERQTTVKTRILSANQHLLRIDQEDKHLLSRSETSILINRIKKLLDEVDVDLILLQDYNKGVLSRDLIRQVLLISQINEIPVVVDPKKLHFYEFKRVNLFKPNLKEIREAVPFEVLPDLKSLTKASNYLRTKLQHQYTMITLSEKGVFIDDGQSQQIIPTIPRNIADVCGAGDTVVSVASLGLALNLDLKTIGILSNLAGGQVCEKVGVVPVNKSQLLNEYQIFLDKSPILNTDY